MTKPYLSEIEAEEMYRDMLDDVHDGPIEICGMKYDVSRVLKECDPIAYRCGFNDFVDSLTDGYIVAGVNDDEDEDEDEDES